MPKRGHLDSDDEDFLSERSNLDSGDEDNIDSNYGKASPRKSAGPSKPRNPAKEVKLPTKAAITSLATDTPVGGLDRKERLDKVDVAVVDRIKKALSLANHAGTGEKEAKAALRMASKLLEKHNITQAEVMAQENNEEKLKRAGMSVIDIRSTADIAKMVNLEQWATHLGAAIETFFDCKFYTTTWEDRCRVSFTFYGLAEQTVAAAYSFEMCYNLILTWSLENKTAKGRHAKNAYRMGVSQALDRLARKEKKEEEQKAIKREATLLLEQQKQEADEERRRLERLKHPSIKTEETDVESTIKTEKVDRDAKDEKMDMKVKIEEVAEDDIFPQRATIPPSTTLNDHGSDDDPDDFDDREFALADFEENDRDDIDLDGPDLSNVRLTSDSPEDKPVPKKEEDIGWHSKAQLIAFRESTVQIADDYLKSQGVELGKAPSAKAFTLKDSLASKAYRQGRRDAEKIDVKRRRIKGAEDD